MQLKSRHEDLIKIISHIKSDKAGIQESKNIESYYKLMYKELPSKSIVDFIDKLISIPVCDYIDNINDNTPLLNLDGTLNSLWDNWHVKMTSQGQLDDVRFNEFREKCFELAQIDMLAADELYRVTRTFLIRNPIVENADTLQFIFMNTVTKIPLIYRKVALEYIRDSYDALKIPKSISTCSTCGYVKESNDKVIIHRLCNPIFVEGLLKKGTLILKSEVFYAITNPGRFEYEVYDSLIEAGFKAIIFPEIERNGDVFVDLGGDDLYLDMKAYNYPEGLYNELVNENSKLKDKYRNRWIVVPDLYYKEQLEYLGYLLKAGGSRIYNIRDLINKLTVMEKRG